ncbi:MAG: SpoIVB peptidase [Clostridia bacterium]|nr:SpoIVB peptidase [Clostridia bacterium]
MKKTTLTKSRGIRRPAAVLLTICIAAVLSLTAYAGDISVYPGGMAFGVRFSTDGILIVAVSEVKTADGSVNPGADAGLKPEDIIVGINGIKPENTRDIREAAKESGGRTVALTVMRNEKKIEAGITPAMSETDGEYRLGLWVRDGSAGIGTVTFIMPDSLEFAGLGHPVCDNETGAILPVREGTVLGVEVSGIEPGQPGLPGELSGYLTANVTGTLISNTASGAYGLFEKIPHNVPSSPISTASKDEVNAGEATIYCTTEGEDVGEYTVEIEELNPDDAKEKNFVVRVTDDDLLSKTGGIVQGMSGSPVIQGGKLIGAVTHVMINDPTRGYGIFIENMLENLPEIS